MKKILISLVIVSLIIGGAYFLNVKFKIIDNAFGSGTSEYKKEKECKKQEIIGGFKKLFIHRQNNR